MSIRVASFAVAALLSLAAPALAQSAPSTQPQTPPNPGAAEAQPSTVTGPGGATTRPAPGSQAGACPVRPGSEHRERFTASPPLGPQHDLGMRINRTVHYVAGDYIAPPLIYDAFAGPSKGINYRSFAARAAFEVPLGQYDAYVGGETRTYSYATRTGPATGLGPAGIGFVPSFTATEYDYDVRAGIKVTGPRIYGAVLVSDARLELRTARSTASATASRSWPTSTRTSRCTAACSSIPNVNGAYTFGGTGSYGVSYREVRYLIGASIQPNHSPVFLDAGFLGDRSNVRTDAPVGFNHQGPYVGLGVHF